MGQIRILKRTNLRVAVNLLSILRDTMSRQNIHIY